MNESIFEIGASGVDVQRIVREVQEEAERKIREGVYADALVARAERTNLAALRSSDNFLGFYLRCLRDAVFVDISDFEIRERRRFGAPLFVGLKRLIWNLLKFYTYRLWSQQNQVNGLLVTSIEGLDEKYAAKIRGLEERIAALEKQTGR
jgi:Tfp pilus assembly protein PilN